MRPKKRRMSDDDHSAGDFFLTNKELNLDQLTWEDIKHTRVGRRLTFDIDKRDRDIIDLKAKCISLEERYRSQLVEISQLSELEVSKSIKEISKKLEV